MEEERVLKCLGVQDSRTGDPKAASVAGGGIDYVDTSTKRQHSNLLQHQQTSSQRDSDTSSIELASVRGQGWPTADSGTHTRSRQCLSRAPQPDLAWRGLRAEAAGATTGAMLMG
jgi:hypothetical protein